MIVIKNHRARIGKTTVVTKPSSSLLSLRIDNSSIDDDGLMMPMPVRLCSVFQCVSSQYRCHDCHCYYCSVGCYRNHSIACTEAFYRRKVKTVIDFEKHQHQGHGNSQQYEQQQSNNDDDDDDDDDGQEIDRSLLKLQDNGCDLSSLAEEELAVLKVASAGDLSRLSEQSLWKPWWDELVVELHASSNGTSSSLTAGSILTLHWVDAFTLSQSLKKIQSVSSLLEQRTRYHANMSYQCLGFLFGYVTALKRFNGDWDNRSFDVVSEIMSTSPCLQKSFQPTDIKDCILMLIGYSEQSGEALTSDSIYHLLQECLKILASRDKVLYSLVHMWALGCVSIELCEPSTSFEALIGTYSHIFQQRPSSSRHNTHHHHHHHHDSFCRKTFFILLALLEEPTNALMNKLYVDLESSVQHYFRSRP